MQVRPIRWVVAVAAVVVCASAVTAQQAHFGVALLTISEGAVTRLHRGAPAATIQNASLMDGDVIATDEGRAEITFRDGTIVHLDIYSRVVVRAYEKVSVLDGRVFIRTSGLRSYLADSPSGNTRVMPASVAELTVKPEPRDVLVRVINGSASVQCDWGSTAVAAYYSAHMSGPSCRPMLSQWVPPHTDDFERWATTRIITANAPAAPPYAGYYWYYSSPAYVYYPYYYRPVYVSPYYVPAYSYYPAYYTSYPSYYPTYWSGAYSYYGSYYPYSYSYTVPGRGVSSGGRGDAGFVPPIQSSPRPTPIPAAPSGLPPARGAGAGARPPQ